MMASLVILATAAAADTATKPAAQGDVTWFYSTLAQTAGALVGLLGAVLVSKIIDHNGVLRQYNDDVRRKINKLLGHIDYRIATMKSQENANRRNLELLRNSPGANPAEIKGLEVSLSAGAIAQKAYRPLTGPASIATVTAYIDGLEAAQSALGTDPTEQSTAREIDTDIRIFQQLLDTLHALQRQLLPPSFTFVLNVLGFLAVAGIAAPLSGLAYITGHSSLMWTMLICFVAGLIAMLAYFWHQFRELTALGQFEWEQTVA
jgi:hypothetical protein